MNRIRKINYVVYSDDSTLISDDDESTDTENDMDESVSPRTQNEKSNLTNKSVESIEATDDEDSDAAEGVNSSPAQILKSASVNEDSNLSRKSASIVESIEVTDDDDDDEEAGKDDTHDSHGRISTKRVTGVVDESQESDETEEDEELQSESYLKQLSNSMASLANKRKSDDNDDSEETEEDEELQSESYVKQLSESMASLANKSQEKSVDNDEYDDSEGTEEDEELQSESYLKQLSKSKASLLASGKNVDVSKNSAYDVSTDDSDEEMESPEWKTASGSHSNTSNSKSPTMLSPPLQFTQPLARSSLLPVPKSMLERQAQANQVKPSKPAVRLMAVPKSMLLKPTAEPEVVDLNSDDDDILIDDSVEEVVRKPIVPATPKTVIEESDASSSGISPSTSANSVGSTSGGQRITSIQNQIREKMQISNNSNKSTGSNTSTESQSEYRQALRQLEEKKLAYRNLQHALKNCNTRLLKDGGRMLQDNVNRCRLEVEALERRVKGLADSDGSLGAEIPKISVKQDIAFTIKDQQIAHLGKKGMETHRVEKALTMDALVSLHSSLATTPAAGAMEEPPEGLLIPLMPHQREALAWMLHREKQTPAGGILADDMGLGKTLAMISLIMRSEEVGKRPEPQWQSAVSGPAHPGKTLVICPASLIGQWEGQVKEHVKRGRLSTLIHHGSSREGRGRGLTGAGLVITTYGVVAQENKTKGALFRVAWDRIILDEAHQIRNHKTMQALACCELQAKHRWCLTGTPVHNKELDIYSLLKFLRCTPFDDLNVWKRWVDNKTPTGTERLNTVMKSILLRRTKEDLKKQGALTDLSTKEFHEIRLELDTEERKVYEDVLNFSKTLFAQYLQQRAEKEVGGGLTSYNIQRLQSRLNRAPDVKTHDILVLLLRLRQICSLAGLIHAMLEDDAAVADGFEKEDPVVEDLFKQVRRLTISAPAVPEEEKEKSSDEIEKILFTSNPVFNMKRQSSKIKLTMKTLKEVLRNTEDKIVVVSQWAGFLKHLEEHLKMAGIKSSTLDGSIPVKNRGALVDVFNDPKSSVRVFLLSLTAGGVGLNLIGGNHLIIMEPHWNPQLESQACDRVYRVGQKKPVHIYKVICKDTIEERIEQLQLRKLALAENVLTGQLKKEINKLTVQDLKSLFGMD